MNLIGIDIGSDSVRVSFRDSDTGKSVDLERPLQRITDGRKHTMSGPALWATILSMLVEHNKEFANLFSGNESGDYTINSENNINDSDSGLGSNSESELESGNTGGGNLSNTGGLVQESHESASISTTSTKRKTHSIPRSSLCVAATCSMVVMQKIAKKIGPNSDSFYVPVEPGHEVIVWMDTRAQAEAAQVASRLPQSALDQIGGTVTPEMGIAKLKWVDTHLQKTDPNAQICVFELYDWISYVVLAGGYCADGRSVRCLAGDRPYKFAPGSRAMDGSVKGWGHDILELLQVSARVCSTPNSKNPQKFFPHVGTPLGEIGPITVGHGCIDCYAGWAGQAAAAAAAEACGAVSSAKLGSSEIKAAEKIGIDDLDANSSAGVNFLSHSRENTENSVDDRANSTNSDNLPGNDPQNSSSLLMVAGTSTCFIAAVDPKFTSPIPGLWGPFDQLLESSVYSFGQPATGQLLAELFLQYTDIIGGSPPFAFVESYARDLELQTGFSLPVLCRHYLYYGDKHGNRSPYGDFRMGEVKVEGANAANPDTFAGVIRNLPQYFGNSETPYFTNRILQLVLQYYLTLEFLAFQTKQLGCKLSAVAGPARDVYIAGSQAQNARLVSLLANLAFPDSRILVQLGAESKYAGSHGIALAMLPYMEDSLVSGSHTVFESTWQQAQIVSLDTRARNVLSAKFQAFEELASWQHRFHKNMGEL